jgi:hypothetical protein
MYSILAYTFIAALSRQLPPCIRNTYRLSKDITTTNHDENHDEYEGIDNKNMTEPQIFSKQQLYDQIFMESPILEFDDDDNIMNTATELITPNQSELIYHDDDDDDVIEKVDTFRFRIKKADLDAAIQKKAGVTASQPRDRQGMDLVLNPDLVNMIERARDEEDDRKVIRIDMDYDDLIGNISKLRDDEDNGQDDHGELSNFQDSFVKREEGVNSRSNEYDETKMLEAINSIQRPLLINSKLNATSVPTIESAEYKLPGPVLSKREFAEDVVGLIFIGVPLILAILKIEEYSLKIVKMGLALVTFLQRRFPFAKVFRISYPIVFLSVGIYKLISVSCIFEYACLGLY